MPSKQVTIQGVMTWEDPGVNVPGFPTHPIAPGGPPPGIWPGPGVPTPPIYYPPTVWPPPTGGGPGLPEGPPGGKPHPPSGGGDWVWSPIYGWVVLPGTPEAPEAPEATPKPA
jgi:hypothetical protein